MQINLATPPPSSPRANDSWRAVASRVRFRRCPVCRKGRSLTTTKRLIAMDSLEGWLCPGPCEAKWWGARDLIASLQAADRQRRPARRFGAAVLWEEAHVLRPEESERRLSGEDQPWWIDWKPNAERAAEYDRHLVWLGGGRLRAMLAAMVAIRSRPHRMLGGRPKALPSPEELERLAAEAALRAAR